MAYVLRIRDGQERTLYLKQTLYIGLRREWSPATRILFVKKSSKGDLAIACTSLQKIIELDLIATASPENEEERKMCLENNWFGKMVFGLITRFLQPIPVSKTSLANVQPAFLHGLKISDEDLSIIENMASSKMIT